MIVKVIANPLLVPCTHCRAAISERCWGLRRDVYHRGRVGLVIGRVVKEIQHESASAFGVTVVDLLSRRRGRAINARREAMWRARNVTGASYPALGRLFNRDHSSVLYNVRRAQRQIEMNRVRR